MAVTWAVEKRRIHGQSLNSGSNASAPWTSVCHLEKKMLSFLGELLSSFIESSFVQSWKGLWEPARAHGVLALHVFHCVLTIAKLELSNRGSPVHHPDNTSAQLCRCDL